jgi:FkbM family methyltransferase
MVCDDQDKGLVPLGILNFGHYEQDELNMSLKLIEKNAMVFDVGANIGWYAINIAKRIPRTDIFAFEPIPKTYGYLKQNLALNHITNVRAEKLGLGEKNHKAVFYYYPEGSGNASAANLTRLPQVRKIAVSVRTLDSFALREKIKRLDFLKCDVEGGELLVFKGGLQTLQRHKPVIFCEMLRKWSAPFGYHPNDIINLLGSMGYMCFTVKGKFLEPFAIMDEKTVETNFFFLHVKRHAKEIKRLKRK